MESFSPKAAMTLAYQEQMKPKIMRVNLPTGMVEEYDVNGLLHREDGPARIDYYRNGTPFKEEYRINGLLHRLDGPAVIHYRENGCIWDEHYYIDDEYIKVKSLEEFKKIVKLMAFK